MTQPRLRTSAFPTLKSPGDIAGLRAAGRINVRAHRLAADMLQPGVTPLDVDAAIAAFYESEDAEPLFRGVPGFSGAPYPAVSCISVNEGIAHGIPNGRPFAEGDIVTVDIGCRYRGWCTDSAETHLVGAASPLAHHLVDATRRALDRAIAEVGRCDRWSEVLENIQPFVASTRLNVVELVYGHGIGRAMHEPPQVSFCRHPVTIPFVDFDLRPGLVFTIEPVLTPGRGEVRVADDQWTLVTADGHPAAHCEHAIAITERGVVVLTA